MKTLLAAILGLAFVTAASPAAAYVVAIPTSISAKSVDDDTDLTAALRSAIDDVLSHAVAFSPTFVTVQTARWIRCADEKKLAEFREKNAGNLAVDAAGELVYLAPSRVNLQLAQERSPGVSFAATREHASALAL